MARLASYADEYPIFPKKRAIVELEKESHRVLLPRVVCYNRENCFDKLKETSVLTNNTLQATDLKGENTFTLP